MQTAAAAQACLGCWRRSQLQATADYRTMLPGHSVLEAAAQATAAAAGLAAVLVISTGS